MSWPGSDNTKVGTSSAAMFQCCNMQHCRPCSVAACSIADLAALQQCCSATTFRHLKIGWFRVIKGDGLGNNPPADQHQLMDQ
jgi:hypothetical protein